MPINGLSGSGLSNLDQDQQKLQAKLDFLIGLGPIVLDFSYLLEELTGKSNSEENFGFACCLEQERSTRISKWPLVGSQRLLTFK
jgi:hypothetical protein